MASKLLQAWKIFYWMCFAVLFLALVVISLSERVNADAEVLGAGLAIGALTVLNICLVRRKKQPEGENG